MKLLFVCLLFLSMTAIADVRVNGFGSIRIGITDSELGGDPYPYTKSEGEVTFKNNTLFGLQFAADVTDEWTAITQFIMEGEEDFEVENRWAYLRYTIDPNHSIKMGRIVSPLFYQSLHNKINYVHDYERLPGSVYTVFDFAVIEGVSLDSRFILGKWDLNTKLLFGTWDGDVFIRDGEVPMSFEKIVSVNLELSRDWFTIFAGTFTLNARVPYLDAAGMDSFISPVLEDMGHVPDPDDYNELLESLSWDDKRGLYVYAGFGIDKWDWLLDVEYVSYGILNSADAINSNTLISLGRRIGSKTTVRVYVDEVKQSESREVLKDVKDPVLLAIGDAHMSNISARQLKGVGISVRYDIDSYVALKLGYYYGENEQPDVGDFYNISGGIDYVF